MSKIEVEYNDNLLQIKKIRTRQSDDDFESIDVSKLVYKEEYQSKIKVTNADEKNKIMLFKRLSQINNDDTNSILLVYAKGNKIKYKITSEENAYKTFVQVPYKILNVNITNKYLKFTIFAYIVNNWKLNIKDIKFAIDSNNQKDITLKVYDSKKQKAKKLLEGNVYKFKFKISELLNSNEEINNFVSLNLKIDEAEVQYKLGIRDKKIVKRKKAKKYYNLPMKSKYIKDYAIHIRRTIAGNLVVVKRLIEPIESTFKFKFLESQLVSYLMYELGKLGTKIRKKKINIFYEKFASKSEECVYDLYEKCKASKKTKNYFVIDKNSQDYKNIKNDKNVIVKFSFKYYWLIYNTSWFIASEAPSHLNILRSNNKYFRKATYDKEFVFLQHGIIYMKNLGINSSFEKGKEGESKYMIISSEKERDIVVDMLKYDEEQLLKTGLGMYSKIKYNHINEKSDDIVTIMLTWKPYEEQLYSFEESTYYKNTVEIYNMLKKYIDKNKIVIIPHPKVFELLTSTDIKECVWQGKISEILEKTKMLITDYSSVCYNSFYQGGGVVFYQPDLEVYETYNGKLVPNDDEYIGKRAFNIKELEEITRQTIENGKINLGKIRNSKFEENYKTINEFTDGKNIDRIFNELKRLEIL